MYDAKFPVQLVVTDLMGSIAPQALGDYHYTIKFTDEALRWREIYLLSNKSDAVASLHLLNQAVVIPSGSRIQRLCTDKGGDYTNEEVEDYCLQTRNHAFTSTATPQQVSVSGRDGNRGLANRAPHAALKKVTPHKALHNKQTTLEHLRVIGARAFVHIERYKEKLDPHAWEERLAGYCSNITSFRIFNLATMRMVESRNVIFLETPAVAPKLRLGDEANFSRSLFNYGDDNDLLRDIRDHTSRLDLNTSISHVSVFDFHNASSTTQLEELIENVR